MVVDCLHSPDSHFIAQVRAGDRDAFERLVERHLGNVWAIAFARLADTHAADDLAQEVFLVAWLHLDSLADPDRFGAWAAQIARNRAADWLRARQRSSKLVTMVPIQQLTHAPVENSEPDMDREEEHELVRKALFTLPPVQREMVLLKYAQGRNQAEIAEQLGVHPATVGRQLEKALTSLQAGLVPVIEQSLRKLRPSRQMAAHVASMSVAIGTMSGPARAALIDASGAAPPALVNTGTGGMTAAVATFKTGVGIMGSTKAVGMAMAAFIGLGVIGAVMYELRSAPPAPPTAVSIGVPSDPYEATPDRLKAILAARKECFPPDVEALIAQSADEGVNLIDPDHKIGSQILTGAVDGQGEGWLWFRRDVIGDGTGRVELGTFNPPKVLGVITEAGEVLPVQMSPRSGTYMAEAQFAEPWPVGERRILALMDALGPVRPNANGLYDVALENSPRGEKIQQIVLVMTPGWRLQSSTESPTLSKEIRGYQIHLWQKHLQKGGRLAVSGKLSRTSP